MTDSQSEFSSTVDRSRQIPKQQCSREKVGLILDVAIQVLERDGERGFNTNAVSTDKQDTDAQRRALASAGCVEIIEKQASGRKARPALAALLDRLDAGDVSGVPAPPFAEPAVR